MLSLIDQLSIKPSRLLSSPERHEVMPNIHTIMDVCVSLGNSPKLVREVAEETGHSKQTVCAALLVLQARGMARHFDQLGPKGAKTWTYT